jgi:4-hydroxybenzoate polyprenyltransferase
VPRLTRDAVTVHRLEFPYPINYLCYAGWGACFAAGAPGRLLDADALAAVLANLLLIVAGLALNTAADVRTDARHRDRGHLAGAALRLGRDRVVRWAGLELIVALALAGLVAARSERPLVAVAAALVIVLQMLYNTEPVRLKRRGLPGVAAFCVAVIVLPFLLSYWAVRPDLDPPVRLIVAGLAALAIGRMTLWSIPDLAADASTGMGTPSVRHGPGRTLALALAVMIAGLALTGWGLWWRYGPVWAVILVAVQGTFLPGAAALLRHADDPATASSVRIRLRAMPPVMIGQVALAIVPLIA